MLHLDREHARGQPMVWGPLFVDDHFGGLDDRRNFITRLEPQAFSGATRNSRHDLQIPNLTMISAITLPSLTDLIFPLNWFLALSIFTSWLDIAILYYPRSKHFLDHVL
jgi:hypothetical protein